MDGKFKPVSRNSSQPMNFGSTGGTSFQRPTYQQPQQTVDSNPFQQTSFQEQPQSAGPVRKKRSNGNNKLPIIIGAVVLVAAIAVGGIFMVNSKNKPNVDSSILTTTGEVDSSVFGDTTTLTTTGVNGNPVQVKWPSDITPTKMELQLDPVTGSPILMLVGEKSGLGTVVRAHDATGALTGFWVIVTDAPALENYVQNNQNNAVVTNESQQNVQTLSVEDTIAKEVGQFVGEIGSKTKDDLLKEFNSQLSEVAKKYGKTNEECLDYYINMYVANANR